MDRDFNPVVEGISALIKLQLDVSKQATDSAKLNFLISRNVIISAIILGLIMSFFAVQLLIRVIIRPLNQAVDIAKEIAAGNLTGNVHIKSNDEIGQMLHTLNVMIKSLTNVISTVRRNAEMIGFTSTQIADGNDNLSQRIEEQASTLEETAASMEELTSTAKNNAENSSRLANWRMPPAILHRRVMRQ